MGLGTLRTRAGLHGPYQDPLGDPVATFEHVEGMILAIHDHGHSADHAANGRVIAGVVVEAASDGRAMVSI